MKNIEVKYNENGKITNVSDNSLHFEQENESLCIKAQLTVDDDKSVRAYIKGANNNSDVTEAISKDGEHYPLVISNEYMSKGTLYVGFEVYDDSGYIERYEPLKVYIDGFVNPGNGSSDNVYVVTVDVAEVETLEPDTPAYVENVGTKKDMRLKIGIPQGKQGDQGVPGKDATIKIGTVTTLEPGSNATVVNNGAQSYAILNFGIPRGDKGDKGDDGEQGVQGEPGYTPVKGEDYYTPEERETFKADILADIDLVLNTKADVKTEDGGFQGGDGANTTSGGAIGSGAQTEYGGAVGNNAKSSGGGAVGWDAKAGVGGAVGWYAQSGNGGAVGSYANTEDGGAVGSDAQSGNGGAIGSGASSASGGAAGANAESSGGGAVGWNAKAGNGFSGGASASVQLASEGTYIDAIQLGTGTNHNPKTLQVYSHTLMNEDGSIPEERLTKAKAYTDEKVSEISSSITTLENNAIECTSSGTTINVKDSAEAKPRGLKLYGKTIQGENPTPENPQELISIGDSGKVDVELYGKNLWNKEYASNKNNWVFLDNSYSSLAFYVGKGNTVTFSYKNKLDVGLKFHAAVMTQNTTSSYVTTWIYHNTLQSAIRQITTIEATEDYVYLRMTPAYHSRFMQYIGNDLQIEISPSATSYESYKKKSLSVSTPNGLPGIPVTSGGNYTDENGQQYICDEVDFEREVYIHRLEKIDSYNGEEITTQYMSTTGELSTGTMVIYVLETPFETPLTDEEKTACKELTMYKPVTNIFNSDYAHMEVDYVADTKTYIDNKFTVLQNAIISTGGNV